MAGLMMDEFQRSSIRVPAVMTALGKGAVNCPKLCSGLLKSWYGAGSGRHTRLSLVMIQIMLKLFVSLTLGACSSCTVIWMLLSKKSLKEESPKHSCFIHCLRKLLTVAPHAFTGHLVPYEHIFENSWFCQNWFIGTLHWCLLEKLSRRKLEIKEIFDLALLQQSSAFPQFTVCPPYLYLLFLLSQCHSFLLLPDPVCMTQMSYLPANCISLGSQSEKEIPNTNWRLAILSLVLVRNWGRIWKVLHWMKYSCIPPAHFSLPIDRKSVV